METKTVERIRELEKKTNEQCIHHWVIDTFNVGRCKNCPAVMDFGALMNSHEREVAGLRAVARQHGGKRGRPRKER